MLSADNGRERMTSPPNLCGRGRGRRSLFDAPDKVDVTFSRKLDDPSVNAAIYANLFDDKDG